MARDISELGADVFDDTPKDPKKMSPKKRNYIIGLSISGVLLVGAIVAAVVLCNTALTDYANVENAIYYYTPDYMVEEGEEPSAVLYRLPSDKTFPSTFRIPSHINGYKVVGVYDRAFSSHAEIKKVVMPNTIEWIGEEAFLDCPKLSSFTWSKNLREIGVDAFKGTAFYEKLQKNDKEIYELSSGVLIYAGVNYFDDNTALVSDKLTEAQIATIKANYSVDNVKKFSELNVKSICSGAFKDNNKLTYIDLPEWLDEVTTSTFEGCHKLEAVDGSHSTLTSIGKKAFANCSELKDINLPSSLVSLGDESFAGTKISEVPDLTTIKEIGDAVFANCTNLVSVNYTLNKVNKDMFNGCSSLSSITWGEGNSNIDNVEEIGSGAFAGTAFTSFIVPKHVYDINDNTFEDCESLQTVSLFRNGADDLLPVDPEEGEEEEEEEEENTGLPCVNHSDQECEALMGVQNIYEAAFKGCTSLSTINLYEEYGAVAEGNDGEFTFPYSLRRCDLSHLNNSNHYPFAGTCPTKVIFSPNMAHVGSYAFENVTSLTTVEVQKKELSKMLTIKAAAFKGCTNLTSIEIPDSVKRIENSAFSGCENLTNFSISSSEVTAINGETFYNCQAITSLKLPETVTSIKKYAFYRTYNLEYVVIPENVTEVLDYAFTECRASSSEEPMRVYFRRTYAAARTGSKRINLSNKWSDNTAFDSYFLEDDETKLPGISYWYGNADSPVEIKLVSLEQSGELIKTNYRKGDKFDSKGLTFKASYDDSTFIDDVSSSIVWNKLNAGDTSVTGTYTVGNVTLTVTVTGITVSA